MFRFMFIFVLVLNISTNCSCASFRLFDQTSLERRIARSINSSIDDSSTDSTGSTETIGSNDTFNSTSSTGSINASAGSSFAKNISPKLVKFLADNPIPWSILRHRPFDPFETEFWINYFVTARVPLITTFSLLEDLLPETEKTPSSPLLFFIFKSDKVRLVEVLLSSAVAVYFNGNLEGALRVLGDLKLFKVQQSLLRRELKLLD